MNNRIPVTPADLVKVWSLSKSSESKQMTLRVPSDVFFKLQVLEEMFPSRSRNEMVSDLLVTALSLFVEGLPCEQGAFQGRDEFGEDIFEESGPGVDFWIRFRELKDNAIKASDLEGVEDVKVGKTSGLKVVQAEQGQAA
jgi:hypothetical protein